jgi:hypothetical protein
MKSDRQLGFVKMQCAILDRFDDRNARDVYEDLLCLMDQLKKPDPKSRCQKYDGACVVPLAIQSGSVNRSDRRGRTSSNKIERHHTRRPSFAVMNEPIWAFALGQIRFLLWYRNCPQGSSTI